MVNSPETYEPSLDVPSFWPTEMGGYFPSRIQQNVLVEDVDTPENRLVKDFLVSVSNLIDSVNSNLDPERGGYVWDRLQEFLSIIEHYLSDAWLLDVGQLSYVPANSQLLQKKDGYRDIFLMYVSMQLAFRIEWDEISNCMEGHNKKLSSMYELWCYLKLVECLDRISESRTAISDLFGIGGKKWSLTLKREEESIREYRLKIRDRRIVVDLMYQRRFEKGASLASYSIPFNPDYSLIVRLDEERPREYIVVHFDAKYSARIDEAQSEDASESDEERVGNRSIRSPWEEDLCKMHTYKDAILRTEGAYILYPGDESKPVIYRVDEDPPCELSPMPSIGAFSMTPGESKSEEMRLEKFIRSVIANCASKLRG